MTRIQHILERCLPLWPAGSTTFARKANAWIVTVVAVVVSALHLGLVAVMTPGPLDGYDPAVNTLVEVVNALMRAIRFPVRIESHEWLLLPWIVFVIRRGARDAVLEATPRNLSVVVVRLACFTGVCSMSALCLCHLWHHYIAARYWHVGDGLGPGAYWLHALVFVLGYPAAYGLLQIVLRSRHEPHSPQTERVELLGTDMPQRGPARVVENGFGPRHRPTPDTADFRASGPLDAHAASEPQLGSHTIRKQQEFRS